VFLATLKDYRPHLAPGERATVLVIACDRRQARVIFRYIRALLTEVPMLTRLIERETMDSFDLRRSWRTFPHSVKRPRHDRSPLPAALVRRRQLRTVDISPQRQNTTFWQCFALCGNGAW
jgi:hypothetical protein